ncbi:AAA family ATPase [Mycobacterium szulgai]|uniref:Transcriptional regulator n=1 Tax=Mycobacterium szulgai TaxID=1787 RepID=A0A1X2DPM0_MYCSZ|nr:AAA family ATPase [Mycobacterium szulgai]MCV7076200.1 AAA family ATPase [Mycobacterium szulgai]ORW90127.1 transcriptional regulator [Mycobacterium szulgai]
MTHGMVLGKFMPPHAGHIYLCEFARQWVDDLTIVVGTRADEPIPGKQRVKWMRELFPFNLVIHLPNDNPQRPWDHPDFWPIWKATLEDALPRLPDFYFGAEPYNAQFAELLGARFVPVDQGRVVVPISATEIRADPLAHWQHIPRCVRPAFVKRISIIGPEGTGKTTLARALAEKLGTSWVPERANILRELDAPAGLDWTEIARGQIASEQALARDADRFLVCDTDPIATAVWAELLAGGCPPELRELAGRSYDLTLLTTSGASGDAFSVRCEQALRAAGRPYVVLSGGWEERVSTAVRAVEELAPARG